MAIDTIHTKPQEDSRKRSSFSFFFRFFLHRSKYSIRAKQILVFNLTEGEILCHSLDSLDLVNMNGKFQLGKFQVNGVSLGEMLTPLSLYIVALSVELLEIATRILLIMYVLHVVIETVQSLKVYK